MTTLHRQENARFPDSAEYRARLYPPRPLLERIAEALAWAVTVSAGTMLLSGIAGYFFQP